MAKYMRWLTSILLVMASTGQAMAAVTAFVDRNPVALDESFTLTVESDNGGNKPDFSVLQRDFDVMGQSSNSSIQIINGQMSRKQQWQVGLMAKHAGEIQIPAFGVGGETSKPLMLTVKAAKQQTSQENSELFMEVSAAPQQLYVQQQLLYTVRLYYSVNMTDGSTLSEPKITGGDAIVEKLGDNRQYQTTVNGRRYGVLEQQYAIFPQKSGSLTIDPLIFDGNVVEQTRSRGFFFDPFNQTTRHVRLRSKEVKLTVQPMPSAVAGAWLPARSVQLLEQWSEDPPKFVVGEPVTRTLAVMADGLTAAQLPSLGDTLPVGVKSYPDQPQLKDTKDTKGITGLRQQKIALIPTQPGTLTLPAIELPWWNVEKKRMETARLPARTVNVAPGSGAVMVPPEIVAPQPQTQSSGESVNAGQAPQGGVDGVKTAATSVGWWPWLSLVLGMGWVLTLIVWWRQRRMPLEHSTPARARADHPSWRSLEQQLKKACHHNDAQQCKVALLEWAGARWPQQPPVSLTAVARLTHPALAEAITELDRALYSNGQHAWHGKMLWQRFEQHKPTTVPERRADAARLEPLYRI